MFTNQLYRNKGNKTKQPPPPTKKRKKKEGKKEGKKEKKALIGSVCQIPWWKYGLPGKIQAANCFTTG